MLKYLFAIACVLAISIAPIAAQDAPPPPMPPGPHLFIPAPEGFEPPPPEEGHEAFEAAFFAAVAGDDILTLEELIAIMPPPEEMPPPMPPEGEMPPPGDMPPHPKGMMIPLPEDFMPPPPEDGPEAFLEAAFGVIAGDDGELTLEELADILPPPPPPPEGGGPPPPPPPPPPGPHLFLPLPEDFVPTPPEEGPKVFLEAAFAAIAGDDLVLTLEELLAAKKPKWPGHKPGEGMGEGMDEGMGEGEGEEMGFCSDMMWESEQSPQEANYYCEESGSEGNLVFRSACNMEGFDVHAISMPANRIASCFAIEHQVGTTLFKIVDQDDGSVVYEGDGSDIAGTVIDPGDADKVYHIELDRATSSADAELTIRFVDHPE